nr:type 2 DNA topoisomerase 6 subunit B-like [Ipomoea batatas]
MEISSVQMLCKHLIFCAVQRCRLRDDPCRLSVKLTPSPLLSPPLVRISVSDTGIGSKPEEYQHLKYPNDLVLAGSHIESCILAIECGSLPLTTESITCLRSGLEDYVLKHGNKLNSICQSCFLTGENLKVGTGIASCSGNMQNNRLVMEAVIIISELSELATPSCFREHEMESELKALDTQIGQIDRSLTRKAVKLALDDLKEKNQGVLLSRHAQKICNYAPDLAKTIARLILSSNDLNFQGECCSLLGLQPRDMKMEAVECSIRERIVSVIGKNDQKPQRSRREAAELLFERPDLMEDEYHQELEDEVYNSFDLE